MREGRLYVGPDNGLLVPAAERAGIAAAHELANPRVRARDGLADLPRPGSLRARRCAPRDRRGARPTSGRRSTPTRSCGSTCPSRALGETRIDATALYVDSFGNIALNLTRDHADEAGIVPGTQVELELAGERYYAVAARTFADARPGDIILYEDSYRNMSLAINRGNAAQLLHAEARARCAHPRCDALRSALGSVASRRSRRGSTGPDVSSVRATVAEPIDMPSGSPPGGSRRRRMALVTDKDWIRRVSTFGRLTSGELRAFEPGERGGRPSQGSRPEDGADRPRMTAHQRIDWPSALAASSTAIDCARVLAVEDRVHLDELERADDAGFGDVPSTSRWASR